MSRKKPGRKTVLVYVEGPSDQTALVHAFETMYDSKSIHIEVLYGDLTSKRSVNPQNIVKKLGNKVSVFREKYSLKPELFVFWIQMAPIVMNDSFRKDLVFIILDTQKTVFWQTAKRPQRIEIAGKLRT